MDFPKFFRTALNRAKIESSRWRGVAVQAKNALRYPGTGDNYREGQEEDVICSVTGTQFKDRDVPLHVINKPNLFHSVQMPEDSAVIIPVVPGMSCFLHTVTISYEKTVQDTGTEFGVSFYSLGVQETLIIPSVTLTVGRARLPVVLDVLCDAETDVEAFVVGTFTNSFAGISYHMAGPS